MKDKIRRSGVDIIGDIPWGTHLCQFYQTKEDLIDILVPYFKAGLENNEFCMWVTSEPLKANDAERALRKAIKDLDNYIKKGQIEILDYNQWYKKSGKFNTDEVLQGWIEKERQALANGYEGLRLTGNIFWLEKEDWKDFTNYEEKINNVIGDYKMIALCTYSLDKCNALEIMDVVSNHQFALIKQAGDWKSIASSESKSLKKSLKDKEAKYQSLFANMMNGFAYHKIVLDEGGNPIDYIFLEVNDAFEKLTGLKREAIIGRRVTQVLPDIEKDHIDWIGVYGKVALTGNGTKFESYSSLLDRWYSVSSYSTEREYFSAIFEDITERKRAEHSLLQANERLELAQRASKAGTWDWDVKTDHIEWSSELLKIFGLDPEKEKASFKVWNNILHPDDLEIANQRIEKALVEHTNLNSEYRIVLPDGQIRWINALGQGIYDDQDHPIRMIGICIDVTERKRTEKALQESREDLKQAQSIGNIGSWRLDVQKNVLTWSEENHRIFGIPQGTPLTYEVFLSTIHPDDREYVDTQWKAGLSGEPYDIEHRIIADGQIKWVREKAYLEFNEKGELLGGFGITQDITQQIEAEEKIRSLAKFPSENPNPVIRVSGDGVILYINEAGLPLANFLGYKVGDTLFDIWREFVINALNSGEKMTVDSGEIGGCIYSATIAPVVEAGYINIYMTDITERKRFEEQILWMQQRNSILSESSVLLASDDPQTTIDSICQQTMEFLDCQVFFNFLAVPEKGKLFLNAYHGIPEEEAERLKWLDYGVAVCGAVARDGKRIIAEDIFFKHDIRTELVYGYGVRAYCCHPLLSDEEVLGTISFGTTKRDKFEEREISMMEITANIVAIAIQRKQMEDDLKASEMRYRELVQNANSIILKMDTQGNLTFFNEYAQKFFGYTEDEVIGKSVFDTIIPENAITERDLRGLVESIVENPYKSYPNDNENMRKNGERVWVTWTNKTIIDENGQVIGILAVGIDSTARKQVENALRESEERLRTVLDNSSITMAHLDKDLRHTWIYNPHSELASSKILGKRIDEMLPDYSAKELLEIQRGVLKSGVGSKTELSFNLNGEIEIYNIIIDPLKDVSGDIIGLTSVSIDVTKSKHAEEKMRELEDKYTLLFEATPDGVITADADGKILSINPSGASILGYKEPDSIMGMNLAQMFPNQLQLVITELSGKDYVENFEIEFVRNDGVPIYIMLSYITNKDNKGNIIQYEAIFTDISKRKKMEIDLEKNRDMLAELVKERTDELEKERASLAQRIKERTAELNLANAELERASRLKDEFMANMSHELRTPINGILGMCEVLNTEIYGKLNKNQLTALYDIEESGRHLLELINDILDISKITIGQIELEIEPVSIRQVCEASMRFIEREAQKKHIRISTSYDSTVTIIEADMRRLKQMLVNLLSNATKFTHERGSIGLEVTGDIENELVKFTVWDTGIGISQEQMPKLFQPFVQLDSSLSRKYSGTGLGLALTRQLVELHNGSISLESEPDKGSRFTFSLPWKQNNEINEFANEEGSNTAKKTNMNLVLQMDNGEGRKPLVLIADDNEISIKATSAYISASGCQVVIAKNGAEAIQQAKEFMPDIILMDIQMPDVNGLEAIQAIRSNEKMAHIPIIALTALAMPGDREKCLAMGANEYMSKPIVLSKLVEIIASKLLY